MSTALVLSGGGSKGAFQAGAISYLKEKGYLNDLEVVAGVSVGALNALLVAADQFGRMRQIWDEVKESDVYKRRRVDDILYGLIKSMLGLEKAPMGRYDNRPLRQTMRQLEYHGLRYECITGAVSLTTGKYVRNVMTKDHVITPDDLDEVLASTAIPLAFDPVFINGQAYADGGVRNISPIGDVLKYKPDNVIIINTQPLKSGYRDHPVNNILDVGERAIDILLDEVFRTDLTRFLELNAITEAVGQSIKVGTTTYKHYKSIFIEPSQPIGRALDFGRKRLNELIKMGKEEARLTTESMSQY